jgi:leucyl/phenylalanyl-tRNA--protein transferase
MVTIIPQNSLKFPSPLEADETGLVAVGGSYHWETLVNAYKNGIFPWFDEKVVAGNRIYNFIYWYSPDPRFVLFKEDFRIGKRLYRYYKNNSFQITFNRCFEQVIKGCKLYHEFKNENTWISNEMIEGYLELHRRGYAISVEVWDKDKLVGGIYGVKIGRYFCGESMFSFEKNASKFAFIKLADKLFKENTPFIDCQVYSLHMSRFGAMHIPRKDFLNLLKKLALKELHVNYMI